MRLVKCAFVAALTLAARNSYADVVFTTGASECKGETPADKAALLWQQLNGVWGLSNIGKNGDQAATIHCPITKYTSNTGITNDQLNNVSVDFNNDGDGLNSCHVDVLQMGTSSAFNAGPLLKESQSNSSINVGTSNVYVRNSGSFGGYWGTSTQWAYADLVCNLTIGSSIATYTIDELGTTQGTLIFPASEGVVSGGYTFDGGGTGTDKDFLESLESAGTSFTFNGMMFPNSEGNMRIMVSPAVASNINFGCTFEGNTLIAQTNPGGASFPARVLSFSRSDRGQDSFACNELFTNGTPTASGDAIVYSYKMF